MNVTEELADWEDSRNMNRKRQWFTIDDALQQLALHKPVQRRYLQQLKNSRNNMTVNETSAQNIPETTSSMTAATADASIQQVVVLTKQCVFCVCVCVISAESESFNCFPIHLIRSLAIIVRECNSRLAEQRQRFDALYNKT